MCITKKDLKIEMLDLAWNLYFWFSVSYLSRCKHFHLVRQTLFDAYVEVRRLEAQQITYQNYFNFFNYDFSQSFYYQVFTEDKIQIFQDRIQGLKSLIY